MFVLIRLIGTRGKGVIKRKDVIKALKIASNDTDEGGFCRADTEQH